MSDLEKQILEQAKESLGKAIIESLSGWQSPLAELTKNVVMAHKGELRELFDGAIVKSINSKEFKALVRDAYHHKLAKSLVASFSGTVDKAFDAMKNDPTIRARAILAIENIIKETNSQDTP